MELDNKTNLKDFLMEVEVGKDTRISNLFNVALNQVFTSGYVNKINKMIRRRIRIKEIYGKNPDIIAYNKGNAIYLEKSNFDKLPVKKKIQFLLHEFIHIMQRKRKVGVFKEFKEINNITNSLVRAMDDNLLQPFPIFLTGKNVKIGPGKKHEILGYLMNNSIKWDALSDEGKNKFVQALKDSRIFNLGTPFWKERLPKLT